MMMFNHVPVKLYEMNATTTSTHRTYKTPEGLDLPSITTCLSVLSRDSIAKWRERVGQEEADRISHRAATRGTAVHEIIEKYINNEENYRDGYTPDIVSSFLDLKPILDSRIGDVYAQEAPLYSTHLGVAGRVDCVAEFDGKLSIIDFKTSKKPKQAKWITNYFMQESAYAIMWEERTRQPITQLVTIVSVDGADPQVFIEHRDNWVRPLRDAIAQWYDENTGFTLDV
jgi:genome maintenance exonuclease 1